MLSDLQKAERQAREGIYETGQDTVRVRTRELAAFHRVLGEIPGKFLDAGCGRGEIVATALKATAVYGVDFSLAALRGFRSLAVPAFLVASDVCDMPFPSSFFDVAVTSQVIQHLPTERHRRRFLAEAFRVLKPRGMLFVAAYNWNRARRRKGEPQDGRFKSGIYYHRYLPSEFRRTLGEFFQVQSIAGVEIALPGTYRLIPRLPQAAVWWDRLWSRVGINYAHLLLAICQKV